MPWPWPLARSQSQGAARLQVHRTGREIAVEHGSCQNSSGTKNKGRKSATAARQKPCGFTKHLQEAHPPDLAVNSRAELKARQGCMGYAGTRALAGDVARSVDTFAPTAAHATPLRARDQHHAGVATSRREGASSQRKARQIRRTRQSLAPGWRQEAAKVMATCASALPAPCPSRVQWPAVPAETAASATHNTKTMRATREHDGDAAAW